MRNDRLSDLQWERIRDHFPEENIPEGRGLRIFDAKNKLGVGGLFGGCV